MWDRDPMTFFYFPLKTVLENNDINGKPIQICIYNYLNTNDQI